MQHLETQAVRLAIKVKKTTMKVGLHTQHNPVPPSLVKVEVIPNTSVCGPPCQGPENCNALLKLIFGAHRNRWDANSEITLFARF